MVRSSFLLVVVFFQFQVAVEAQGVQPSQSPLGVYSHIYYDTVNVRIQNSVSVTCWLYNTGSDTIYLTGAHFLTAHDNTFPTGQVDAKIFYSNLLGVRYFIEGEEFYEAISGGSEMERYKNFGLNLYELAPGDTVFSSFYLEFKGVFQLSKLSFDLDFWGINSEMVRATLHQEVWVVDKTPTITYLLGGSPTGWYLISFPVSPPSDNIYSLIPNLERAVIWDIYQGYLELSYYNLRYYSNTMGRAIWVKVSRPTTFVVTGEPIMAREIQVISGWNLLGSTFFGSYVRDNNNIITATYNWNWYTWYQPANYFVRPKDGIWVYAVEHGNVQMGDYPPGGPDSLGKICGGLPPAPPWEWETTLVENEVSTLLEFSLFQNFPNPFNPTTTIGYSLPKISQVKLIVYNLAGQEVATLIDGQKSAGQHEVVFDASHLPSGIYFYNLQAGEFNQTRRMQLIK